ncbi:MAG: hypothetical protein R3D01_12450 [Hyphomicrobiales bacterium]
MELGIFGIGFGQAFGDDEVEPIGGHRIIEPAHHPHHVADSAGGRGEALLPVDIAGIDRDQVLKKGNADLVSLQRFLSLVL